MEWPAQRCYVGLVAVGVQEKAEDILVPPLLRNCLTLMTFPFVVIISSSRTVVLAIVFYCLGHSKMSMNDDDDDDDDGRKFPCQNQARFVHPFRQNPDL